jgi:hypothetical protein
MRRLLCAATLFAAVGCGDGDVKTAGGNNPPRKNDAGPGVEKNKDGPGPMTGPPNGKSTLPAKMEGGKDEKK